MHNYFESLQPLEDYYNIDGRKFLIYFSTIGCGLSQLHISVDISIRQLLNV